MNRAQWIDSIMVAVITVVIWCVVVFFLAVLFSGCSNQPKRAAGGHGIDSPGLSAFGALQCIADEEKRPEIERHGLCLGGGDE